MWMLRIVITTSSHTHTHGTFGNWGFTIDDVAKARMLMTDDMPGLNS